MPSKNSIKIYVKDAHYHIYNRGVEKRKIFLNDIDYKTFLKYLKEYLSSPKEKNELMKTFTPFKGASFKGVPRQPKNYKDKIELVAFCLMPNHFHLLIKQRTKKVMENFMRSLATRYSMYFNKKYNRIGKLFQGHYKATLINDESYLLHLTRYIHLNPLSEGINIKDAYSSYSHYLKTTKHSWISSKKVTDYFDNNVQPVYKKFNSYKKFVENSTINSVNLLGNLILENDES